MLIFNPVPSVHQALFVLILPITGMGGDCSVLCCPCPPCENTNSESSHGWSKGKSKVLPAVSKSFHQHLHCVF